MRKASSIAVAAAFAFAASLANAGILDDAWLKGTTDKAPVFYRPGETMVFTIEPQDVKGELGDGEYFLRWERTGDDGVTDKGKEPFDGKTPFTYKTSIAKPGFVRLYAEVVDAKGKVYTKKFTGDATTPEGKIAMNKFEKAKKAVFFDGGAAADIDSLEPGAPEPKDFDEFWAKERAELAKVPFNAKRVEVPCQNPDVTLYAVSLDCTGGAPVTGYLSIPKAVEKGRKYGIRVGTFGYGVREQVAPKKPHAAAILFDINAHGMLLREFGGTDEYYKGLGKRVGSNGYSYAFDPEQNSNPQTAYFRGMILRLIRAIEYVRTLPGWDGKTLHVTGGSQGGAYAIWGAGCGEGVTFASSTVTGFCDCGAELVGRLKGPWPKIKYVEPLGYFDPVNFAKRVPASCRVEIPRAGLGDYTCQPSSIAVLWNSLKCPKSILWMQGSEHGYVPPEYAGRDTRRSAAFSAGGIEIGCEYPGGNVKVTSIDDEKGVVKLEPDMRDSEGRWFHWDFTISGAADKKLRFKFPDGYEYLSSLGPAICSDGKTWRWLRPDGTRHEPANAFEYTFGKDENKVRFSTSIPYSQKDWDAFTAKWRKSSDVKFETLCKSQSGMRDTELVRVPCRGKAKWLFVFTARHHACETSASPVVEGVFEELMSGSPEVKWLRANADCLFVPFMDKDGVEEGDQGKNRRPHDHNRDYVAERYTSVKALKALVERESQGKRLVFIDNHSPHVRSLPNGPEQDEVFSFGASDKEQDAVWNLFRSNWIETQKGGKLNYDGKFDIKAGEGYDKQVAEQRARGLMGSRAWASSLPNCHLSTCCEYGYSRCGGVFSFPAARELGHSMLKALARTAKAAK